MKPPEDCWETSATFCTVTIGRSEVTFANACEPSPDLAGCDDTVVAYPQLYYLSFVTMTTLGYGDVLPLSRAAQGVATLAAVSGQLFVAILIGRVLASSLRSSKHTGDS